ncbi:MAG: hypothetical protein AAF363_17585 [Bacteroidota bacterium]
MIKFIKEIISSIKEGVKEGKQELTEDKKLQNTTGNSEKNSLLIYPTMSVLEPLWELLLER